MYHDQPGSSRDSDDVRTEPALPDTQAERDTRGLVITSAGVAGVRLPFQVIDVDGTACATVVSASTGVEVPADARGTHMSRFVEFLNERAESPLLVKQLPEWTERLRRRLDAPAARLDLEYSAFVSKRAPVSGRHSLVEVPVRYRVRTDQEPGLSQSASVLATTVCPCSRAISQRGAHNQRCTVRLQLEVLEWVPVHELVAAVDAGASCAVYGVLKREDEKAVTEAGYDNAKFVEDVVRDVYGALANDSRITALVVEAISHESIHGHEATAIIEG